MLITKGADVKAESRVGTPLHAASAGGQKDNVEVLLENHADVRESHFYYLFSLEKVQCYLAKAFCGCMLC
ncbi:hypothetical protein SLEP1_g60424 [Rubroshorea leprosula]|uniref:Ankyrin repeat protein n=1 Tax=Rubroshorea leprosula TaxID=152421 RepID=A0AAV5MZW5_9ROSI|nr:hypothetical protein SLEP1_g60424 [Rubroshorea leprosula]